VELLLALGLGAAAVMALGAVVYQAVRAAEAVSASSRGAEAAEKALFGMMHRVACAWTPPGMAEDESAFELAAGNGVDGALLAFRFHAPAEGDPWDPFLGAERVAYEVWPAKGGGRELRRLTAPEEAGEAWTTNVVFRGGFVLAVRVREAPEKPGGAWGGWEESWPPGRMLKPGPGRDPDEAAKTARRAVPGAVRLELALDDGTKWTLDTVVEAALGVPSLRPKDDGDGEVESAGAAVPESPGNAAEGTGD